MGQRTDYDKLVLEVETDGSIAPSEAVCRAANIINQYMGAFSSLLRHRGRGGRRGSSIFAPEGQESNAELDKQIEDLDLSVRSYNCLKRAGIHSVRQLVEFSENDLLNIRNFGAKSIEEVKDKLISMDLNLKLIGDTRSCRHYKKGRKLGTDTSHTKAMKKSLVCALLANDRIKTIDSRAKEIRPDVDKIITWAKQRRPAFPPPCHRGAGRQGTRARDLREGRAGHVRRTARAATPAS